MSADTSTPESELEVLVASIPVAGKMGKLGRAASYAAAKAGVMPTITIGHLKRVPLAKWRRILNGDD
jgi:hypothetical protein